MKSVKIIWFLLLAVFLALPSQAAAAAALTLSPISGPPTILLKVTGTGFGVTEVVDVFFDTTDMVLALTDATGKFTQSFKVAASATPGVHWVTALGRTSNSAVQKSFTVRTNWSMFHMDPSHKGNNPYENVLNVGNVWGLEQAWAFKSPSANAFQSSPAVVNGVVYAGCVDGKLYAINAATGVLKWGKPDPPGGAMYSSPAVSGGYVYIGSYAPDGKLYAFNATTGAAKTGWPVTIGASIYPSPTVVGNVVYFGAADNKVYAYKTDGTAFWPSPFTTGGIVYSSPAVVNGVVYIGSQDNKLYALKASDGTKLWDSKTTITNGIASSPAVANGVVYVGSLDMRLYAFNAVTGDPLWPSPPNLGGALYSSPAVAYGLVFVGSYDPANPIGKVYAFKATTGAKVWEYTTGDKINSSPAVANGVLYIGSYDKSLYAFNARTGELLWSFPTGDQVYSSPAVADGVVYVGSKDQKLYAFNLEAGLPSMARAELQARRAATAQAPDPAELVPDYSLQLEP